MNTGWKTAVPAAALLAAAAPAAGADDGLPGYLADRGEGVTTSLFGTYVRKGEWLVYPFYEYTKSDERYNGDDLGISDDEVDYTGTLHVNEYLLFISYGLTDDVSVELEPVLYETASLDRASNDTTSGLRGDFDESQSILAVQAQLRWRLLRETESRPEIYTWVEADMPLEHEKVLLGAASWEGAIGIGIVKGFSWGTVTPRVALNYDHETDKIDYGEWAVEYLKRLNSSFRMVATVEGQSDREISVIGELQWNFLPNAMLKLNSGFGIHGDAPDVAPEVGILFSF